MSVKPDPARLALALGLLAAARHVLREVGGARKVLEAAEQELRQLAVVDLFQSEPPVPAPDLAAAITTWLLYKKERGETYKPLALAALHRRMAEMGPERAAAAVEFSMGNHYQGLVEPRVGQTPRVNGRAPGTTAGHVQAAQELDRKMGLR